MNTHSRAALTLVIGATSLPSMAQSTRASQVEQAPSAASGPTDNAGPLTPIEWFVAGVGVGIVLTLAWVKIRGGSNNGGTTAPA